ncbi:MAG: hypothetical protein HWE25_03715 [Alphaproteobacteria bacterium]|nr:hypothetical protein [Alphaproteobacteria bacterium]
MRQLLLTILIVLSGTVSARTAQEKTAKIEHLWTVTEGMFEPESVVVDKARSQIYVSNVVGYGLNGQGFISKLSLSGEILDAKWITGLNGPTGMVLKGDKLYFADVNALKILDIKTGIVTDTFETFHERPCLNDVAVADDGAVFVSGSCTSTIYRLMGPALMPFIEDSGALKFVNGLFVSDELLLSGGWQIRLWNRYSGEPLANGPVTRQPDVRDIDGIAWDGSAFLISMVDDARLWRLGASGVAYPISDDAFHALDFFYDDATGLLIMPQIIGEKGHQVSAYRLTFD